VVTELNRNKKHVLNYLVQLSVDGQVVTELIGVCGVLGFLVMFGLPSVEYLTNGVL
jgi:hypothetical protein